MKFKVGRDKDTILPEYDCGARGPRVSVSLHGVNYATWKLIDDLERHIGHPANIKCRACYEKDEKRSITEVMANIGEALQTMAKYIDQTVSKVMEETTKAFQGMYDSMFNDPEGSYDHIAHIHKEPLGGWE